MCLFVGLLWERLWVPTQVPPEPPPLGSLAGGTGAAAFPSALPAFYKTGIFLRPPNRSSQWTQQREPGLSPSEGSSSCCLSSTAVPAALRLPEGCLTLGCGWLGCSLWDCQEKNIPKMRDTQLGRSVLTAGVGTVRRTALNCPLPWIHHQWFLVYICLGFFLYIREDVRRLGTWEWAPGAFSLFLCKAWLLLFTTDRKGSGGVGGLSRGRWKDTLQTNPEGS